MSLKTYNLVSAFQRNLLLPNLKSKNTCIECCGKNLYIGTEDGVILHFVFQENRQSNGRLQFSFSKQSHKVLSTRKSVEKVLAASALNRLFVLSENTITLHQMIDLEPAPNGGRLKGATCVQINNNPSISDPFSVEICVTMKKNSIRVYIVSEDKFSLLKEVSTSEQVLKAAISGSYICVALPSMYQIIEYHSGHVQELFPVDIDVFTPTVTQISKGEFLLSAPGSLGMFASTTGSSQRPPLQWNCNVLAVAFIHPYVVALCDEFITVHSILDQKQKQAIPFQNGLHLEEYEGRLLVSTVTDIYYLDPIPVENQIKSLLAAKRIPEALELAKNARKTALTKEQFILMYQRIQQQAGFLEFAEMNFSAATDLFLKGHLDPRELICLYPEVAYLVGAFVRALPPLHEIPDVSHLIQDDEERKQAYIRFLQSFLENVRGKPEGTACRKEVDGTLLTLYAQQKSPRLTSFLNEKPEVESDLCIECLKSAKQYNALGMYYNHLGQPSKALEVWTQICDAVYNDPTFPGFHFILDYLVKLQNAQLIWRYSDWLLKHNQSAVRVFIDGATDGCQFPPDKVLESLAKYPDAHLNYLEHLVFVGETKEEIYHTQLVMIYLEEVLAIKNNQTDHHAKIRQKLQNFLSKSRFYKAQMILSKIKDTSLFEEQIILHRKLGDHQTSLKILVHQLKDFTGAEDYCRNADPQQCPHLFLSLLKLYLDPAYERNAFFVAPAVELLNNNRQFFDALEVFKLLPSHWSIGLLGPFLCGSTRASMHKCRMVQIERNLTKNCNITTKLQRRTLCCQKAVVVDEDKQCDCCGEPFTDSQCAILPSQTVVHAECIHKHNSNQIT